MLFCIKMKFLEAYMPRPRLPDDDKKQQLTISISGYLKRKLRKHGSYSALIEKLVVEYFSKKGNKD